MPLTTLNTFQERLKEIISKDDQEVLQKLGEVKQLEEILNLIQDYYKKIVLRLDTGDNQEKDFDLLLKLRAQLIQLDKAKWQEQLLEQHLKELQEQNTEDGEKIAQKLREDPEELEKFCEKYDGETAENFKKLENEVIDMKISHGKIVNDEEELKRIYEELEQKKQEILNSPELEQQEQELNEQIEQVIQEDQATQ